MNTGDTIGGAGADIGGGSWWWTYPSYATVNDNQGARCAQYGGTNSNNLAVTNFGFSLPSGTVDGIIVTVRNKREKDNQYRENLNMTKDGTTKVGTDRWAHEEMSTDWTNTVDGSSSDLWGTTWTTAEVNASTFGVILQTQKTGSTPRMAYIDCVWIDVYYTPSGEPKHAMHYKRLRSNQ